MPERQKDICTRSINWPQFMLRWFIRFPEFTEFPFRLEKTPVCIWSVCKDWECIICEIYNKMCISNQNFLLFQSCCSTQKFVNKFSCPGLNSPGVNNICVSKFLDSASRIAIVFLYWGNLTTKRNHVAPLHLQAGFFVTELLWLPVSFN